MDQRRYSIYDLLGLIRQRPAMYMGSTSIVLLRAFLAGYDFAARTHDIVEESEPDFGKFHDWVAQKFGWNESTAGWDNIILQETGNDESAAFDRVYTLIDQFKVEESSHPMVTGFPFIGDDPRYNDAAVPPLPTGKVTFDEFLDWCRGYEKARVEWVDGDVVIMAWPDLQHCLVKEFLKSILWIYVNKRELGCVLGGLYLCRFRTARREVGFLPDILFLAENRLNLAKNDYLDGVPDLIVEIVAPGDGDRDFLEKFADYESAGVHEYWVIDPATKRVAAWSRNAETGLFQAINEADNRFNSKVIPGFYLRQEWLWSEPELKLRDVMTELGV